MSASELLLTCALFEEELAETSLRPAPCQECGMEQGLHILFFGKKE